MGLVLNDEQRMLRDAAHEFLKEQSPISALRSLRDSKDDSGFSRELWGKLVELGWTGMTLPERFGGSEFGFGGLAVAFEETGRTLTASPLLSTIVLGGGLINRLGSDPLRNELLPGLIGGKQFLALALDESPRHQPTQIQTEGRRIDNEWVLNGRKTFVLDGHVADTLLVAARTAGADDDPSGISLFMVPRDTPGLDIERLWMVDSRNAANIDLSDVRVPQANLLGEPGGAGAALERVLDEARTMLAAEMLGSAEEAFERTLAYLKLREQFDVVIGSFQALKHRAALMFTELELARSAVVAAASALDDDDNAAALASLAKAQAGKAFELVSSEAIQMHGGIGMTDEEEIGFFLKRARVAEQTFGDVIFHRDRYARLSGF